MREISSTKIGGDNNIIMAHPKLEYFYIPVLKNASSYAYDFFRQWDWKNYQVDDFNKIKHYRPVVIFREPVERWCSGFSQDYFFNKLNLDLDNHTVLDNIFTSCCVGVHSNTQYYFIEKFDLSNAIFLNVDDNLIQHLESLMLDVIKVKNFINLKKKRRKSMMDYGIKDKIKTVLQNPKYMERLSQYLSKDTEIYNSAKFYTG